MMSLIPSGPTLWWIEPSCWVRRSKGRLDGRRSIPFVTRPSICIRPIRKVQSIKNLISLFASLLCNAVFDVWRTVEASELFVEVRHEFHRDYILRSWHQQSVNDNSKPLMWTVVDDFLDIDHLVAACVNFFHLFRSVGWIRLILLNVNKLVTVTVELSSVMSAMFIVILLASSSQWT